MRSDKGEHISFSSKNHKSESSTFGKASCTGCISSTGIRRYFFSHILSVPCKCLNFASPSWYLPFHNTRSFHTNPLIFRPRSPNQAFRTRLENFKRHYVHAFGQDIYWDPNPSRTFFETDCRSKSLSCTVVILRAKIGLSTVLDHNVYQASSQKDARYSRTETPIIGNATFPVVRVCLEVHISLFQVGHSG